MEKDNPQPVQQEQGSAPQKHEQPPHANAQQVSGQQKYRQQPPRGLEQEITSYRIPPLMWGVAAIVTGWAGLGVLTISGILPAIIGIGLVVASVACLVGAFKSKSKEYAQISEMGVRRATETMQGQSRGQAISNEKGTEMKVQEEKGTQWQQKEADRRAAVPVQEMASR